MNVTDDRHYCFSITRLSDNHMIQCIVGISKQHAEKLKQERHKLDPKKFKLTVEKL